VTLLQTVFSGDRIIQVSDRRLTLNGQIFDDEYTKLVCWNQTFSAGFTGIARIDRRARKSTAEWIAEVLCDYPAFVPGVQALRQEAENRVSKLSWADKRLAIVVAGFDFRQIPLIAEIANFDTATNVTQDADSFRLRYAQFPPGRKTGTHSVGAGLGNLEHRLLSRYVPRILQKDKANGHNRAIKLLVENQRRVHRKDPLVGADSQAVTIPSTRDRHQQPRRHRHPRSQQQFRVLRSARLPVQAARTAHGAGQAGHRPGDWDGGRREPRPPVDEYSVREGTAGTDPRTAAQDVALVAGRHAPSKQPQ